MRVPQFRFSYFTWADRDNSGTTSSTPGTFSEITFASRCSNAILNGLPDHLTTTVLRARRHEDEVRTQGLDAVHHSLLGSFADGDHGDQRSHANNDPQHREQGSKFIGQ